MKLNDPFGRMEIRHQAGYESMRDTMRRSGIDTPQAAREIIRQSKKRTLKFLVVGVALLLLVTLLFSRAMPITFSLAVFLVVWVFNSNSNAERYIQRYIDEELQ